MAVDRSGSSIERLRPSLVFLESSLTRQCPTPSKSSVVRSPYTGVPQRPNHSPEDPEKTLTSVNIPTHGRGRLSSRFTRPLVAHVTLRGPRTGPCAGSPGTVPSHVVRVSPNNHELGCSSTPSLHSPRLSVHVPT